MIIKKTLKQMCVGRRYMQLWKGKKVLLVAKYTRVERERLEHPNVSEKKLLNQLVDQGANLETILKTHNEHYNIVKEVTTAINHLDVESKIINLKVFKFIFVKIENKLICYNILTFFRILILQLYLGLIFSLLLVVMEHFLLCPVTYKITKHPF